MKEASASLAQKSHKSALRRPKVSADKFDDSDSDSSDSEEEKTFVVQPSKFYDGGIDSEILDPCPMYDALDGCESHTNWYAGPMSAEFK